VVSDLAQQQMPEGYQQTEVGVIPEDWNVEVVKAAYEICNTLRLPISRKVREGMQGKYPYYGPTKIQDYINEYRVNGEYALIGEDGDHFLKYEVMPQTQLANGKFNVNNHAHLIRGKKNLTEWFYFYFRNRDISLYLTRQGAGRFKLSKASLERLPCALPSITEQKEITSVLSDVDALITSLEKLIAKKRAIKTATMQQLLTGKKRLPPFGTATQGADSAINSDKAMDQTAAAKKAGYKQTELGEIPEDWEVAGLGELFEEKIDRKRLSSNDEISFVGMQDVTEEAKISSVHQMLYCDVKGGFTYLGFNFEVHNI